MNNIALVNVFNDGRELYLFHRIGKKLNILREKTFFPYLYNPSDSGLYRGYFGKKYTQVRFKEPYLIPKNRTLASAEADVIYTKRYMIDKIRIEKAELRYLFLDIETKSKDFPDPNLAKDPISCVTVYDNYIQNYTTFCITDYNTEYELIQNLVNYIKEIQPDLILGWNMLGFDYPYLCNRFPEFASKISPIGMNVKRNNFPAGISIVDYMDWVKKVYKYKKYALEYVYCDEFKLPFNPKKYDFSIISADIKQKNQADVRKMVELESKLRLIPYFDELRRLTKVLWEDLTMYSILVDNFILQIAKEKGVVLPTKPDEEEKLKRQSEEITGGYVFAKPGLHENIHLFDVGGTYPNMIITFNLDPANKRTVATEQTTTINKIIVAQNSNAIVPTVCRKLVNSRKEIQDMLAVSKDDTYELLKKKDEAHKALNNSVYGVLLFKSSRLYDRDIASTITYLARFLIRYTKWCLMKFNLEVIASDTDSIFVKTELSYGDVENAINTVIIPKWLKHFNKDSGTLKFKYEGTYRNLFVVAKKHYIGNMIKANGESKKVIKGIEILRSDASAFQEDFQEELLDKILNKESKESIISWIKLEIERMINLPLKEISFPCKLSKPADEYKTEGIHVRALRYAQKEHPDWQVNIGQDYYYTYIVPKTEETYTGNRKVKGITQEVQLKKAIDVMAFDEFQGIEGHEVDYKKLTERNILMKCEGIFQALNWKIDELNEEKIDLTHNPGNDKHVERDLTKSKKTIKKEINVEKTVTKNDIIIDETIVKEAVKSKVEVKSEVDMFNEKIILSHSFKTKAEITERTIMVAEAFGLGIDDEKDFTIYDNAELNVKSGDIIYITGDSGSGKSWMLKNIFAEMSNSISIDQLKIDDNEIVVEGIGKDLSDALMKLNIAGLGDAFLYLRKYSQLSDGQKYRYRIAKFIDQEDKDIWILDEFCATLDRVTAKVVAYNLQKIARKLNKTVVVATTHTDLLNEIRPTVHILKGYESDIKITYYKHEDWKDTKLEFYNDIKIEVGDKEDYAILKRFHYRQAQMGGLKKIYKCTYKDEVIGVIAITTPHLALKGRNIYLENKYAKMTKENCIALNKEFECIARIIIHPKYRGIGLSYYMIKEYFKLTDIQYVETLAVMAQYSPFFEKAGMTRIDVDADENRQSKIDELKVYGFNINLLASKRYFDSVYDKLDTIKQEQVKEIIIKILERYRGQIVSIKNVDLQTEWRNNVKHITRANTVYLVKKLK